MTASYFQTLARYNMWANRRLLSACASLPMGTYEKERPSFFGSIHKTLNHILVADRIWLGRFEGVSDVPKTLDALLTENLEQILSARESVDKRILSFTQTLDDDRVNKVFRYNDLKGDPHAVPMVFCLAHFFNHHTHHRGQVHGMLSEEGIVPPALDLIYFMLAELEGLKI